MRLLLLSLLLIALAPRPVSAGPFLGPETTVLPNGVTLVHQAWEGPEIVDTIIWLLAFKGGVIEEESLKRGATNLLMRSLVLALEDTLRDPVSGTMPSLGIVMEAEYSGLAFTSSPQEFAHHYTTALGLIAGDSDAWVKYIPDQVGEAAELTPLNEDASFMADLLMRTTILGHSPYVNPILGTPQTIVSVEGNDLRALGERLLHPSRLLVCVVHHESVPLSALQEALGGFAPEAKATPLPPITVPPTTWEHQELKPMEGASPTISLGVLGPAMRDPELPAFLVAAVALGDPENGRFAGLRGVGPGQALRVEWDIARYREATVAAFQVAGEPSTDVFAMYDRFHRLLVDAGTYGLSATEVGRAQGLLQAELGASKRDPEAMLLWLANWSVWENVAIGRRFEAKVAALSQSEVNQALAKYFAPEQTVWSGLDDELPEDYYFRNPDDVLWGTFVRPEDRGADTPELPEHYDPNAGPNVPVEEAED